MKTPCLLPMLTAVCLIFVTGVPSPALAQTAPEPNMESALTWWQPQRGVWTPMGWPDHLFRFNIVYNGTILCPPAGAWDKPHIRPYQGQDFQVNVQASADGKLPEPPTVTEKLYWRDHGLGMQGWHEDKNAPVLYTDYALNEGAVLRQEIFTRVPGAQAVESGVEPLFAWVRLSVNHLDEIRAPEKVYFDVQLSKIYYGVTSTVDDTLFFSVRPELMKLADGLTSTALSGDGDQTAGLLVQHNGQARLQVMPGGDGAVSLAETGTSTGVYHLKVELPARVGAHTDLLLPMLAVDADVMAREAAVGYETALAEVEQFWSQKPETAVTISTPENYINQALRRNIQFAQIIAERNPETGEYAFLSGSYGYDVLWSTPTSMISHMFLDLLGYHDVVEKHIALYKANQGTIKPPGDAFTTHTGYLSTPKSLTSIDWLSDHGAILEILSRHALLTGRDDFTQEWLDPILRGLDFVRHSAASTNHGGVKGLMPPAVATDSSIPVQAVWIQAWIYKGMVTSVELLERLDHPQASEYRAFANEFRATFIEAFENRIPKEPQWTDAEGKQHHVLPPHLVPPAEHHVYDDAFMLDTGALVLPWAGLYEADDPKMVKFAEFFRSGPNTRLWSPQTSALGRAILTHEISSCEPCYSWNIVNSWKTGDRQRFLEGMYALFSGAISPQTYINCEHRNAMYGTVFVAPLMTWCLRQAVVDDQLRSDELHLLRLCPLAWVTPHHETQFLNMPTNYGPVDLSWQLTDDGATLDVTVTPRWRQKPGKVVLHVPPVPGLKAVRLNGSDAGGGALLQEYDITNRL